MALMVKKPSVNAGDMGLIPGLGRSPGEGNGKTHSSVLAWEILRSRGVWWAIVHGVTKESDMT